jgi:hypothetical protein
LWTGETIDARTALSWGVVSVPVGMALEGLTAADIPYQKQA